MSKTVETLRPAKSYSNSFNESREFNMLLVDRKKFVSNVISVFFKIFITERLGNIRIICSFL
jgi:hypothetical protein